jgi:hypothetical protein
MSLHVSAWFILFQYVRWCQRYMIYALMPFTPR